MFWILQENIFKESAFDRLVETLERFELPHSIHKIIPFVGDIIPDASPEGKVICMGSYSLRHLAKKKGWTPGVFDLEAQDFNVQMQHWGPHMLNADAKVVEFQHAVLTEEEMFVRPVQDSKVFAGGVMNREEFHDWRTRVCVLNHDYGTSLSNETLVQICPLKKILAEYRFWIVKGKIITHSLYKMGRTVMYDPYVPDAAKWFVDMLIQPSIIGWQPAEAFVIDVCETEEGWKVVEINTLNSCGFYAADMQKLVMSLEDAFGD